MELQLDLPPVEVVVIRKEQPQNVFVIKTGHFVITFGRFCEIVGFIVGDNADTPFTIRKEGNFLVWYFIA